MKALTNILTRMLMLLLMVVLATCTNDDGADEVMPMDDGMVQLKVGMTVPNLKITTRAADEGEKLTSIKGFCYDESGTLTKIADATDITTTTFNMRVPTETRIIHFLANLPNDCTLPKVWTTTEDALKNLTTKSSSMTYWGRTTFNATPADCDITFYRNKARIIIKAADGSSVGTVGIAGVVNAYDTGMLVPYSGTYNFDLLTNDYPTVPTEDFTKGNVMVNTNPLPTQYDVFEHPNTGTSQASSLYAICLIGSKYYKVALGISDEDGMVTDNYFRIIRNHKYVISVADVDDVDASLGANLPNDAVNLAPINDPNIKVEDVVDVVVTLSTSTETLDYNTTSISNLVLSVTVPPEVNTLTLNTPGFTIVTYTDTNIPDTDTKYLVNNGNGSFTVNHPENDEEHTFSFRLQLTDKSQQSYTLSCIAASNDANVKITQPAEISVLLNKVDDNDNVYWMGASTLDYFDSATKIPIPAEKLTKGATVTFEYEKGSNPSLSFQHASWADFENASTLDLSQNTTSFEITEELYNEIQEKKGYVYDVADIGMVVQGGEITLKKITIEPAQVENVSLTVNPSTASLYYDSNNTQQITVTVPVGKTLAELTITPSEDCFTITSPSGEMTATNSVYTYAPNGGVTGTVVFTIAPKSGYNFTNVSSSTLTFAGTGVDMNVVEAKTTVTLTATPAIKANADKNTLYYDTDNQTTTVTVNIPKGVSSLSITATDFTVALQSGNGNLNLNNGNIYTLNDTNGQTAVFVFTMNNVSSTSGQTSTTIEFSDNAGVATSPSPITISLTEKPESVSSLVVKPVGTNIINLDGENQSVTLKLTKPTDVNQLFISGVSAFDVSISPSANSWTSNNIFYCNNLNGITEIEFTFTYKSNYLKTAGTYDITFTNESNTEDFVSETILATKSFENNVIWTGAASVNWDPGLYISKATFEAYVGQTIAIDVLTAESGDTQMNCMVSETSIYQSGNLEKGVNKTLNIDIPETLNSDVVMAGAGVTILKIYIPETTP